MHGEPGTGTQYHAYATEPCTCETSPYTDADECPDRGTHKHEKPSRMTLNGRTWAVGREYWDSEVRDLAVLVEIQGKSAWCNLKPADECPPKLVFEYLNIDGHPTIDPHVPDDSVNERFTLRKEPPVDLPP